MFSKFSSKLKQVSKSAIFSFIILVSITTSLTLTAYTFKPKLDSTKIQELLNGFLGKSVQAQAQDSGAVSSDPFAVTGRYYNTDKPFSIFVSCTYSFVYDPVQVASISTKDLDKKNKDSDDKKLPQTVNVAVFGYSNHTGKTIALDKSKLD